MPIAANEPTTAVDWNSGGFEREENYAARLAAIHENAAPRVRPPALTWHLAFWNPLPIRANGNTAERRRIRRSELDDYLTTVWQSISETENGASNPRATAMRDGFVCLLDRTIAVLPTFIGPPIPHLPEDRRRSVTFIFSWHGARSTIHLTEHTEYVTLSMSIDLSPNRLRTAAPGPIGSIQIALATLDRLVRRNASSPSADFETQHAKLYANIWSAFDKAFLVRGRPSTEDLGKVFCDFRGVLVANKERRTPKFSQIRRPRLAS